MESCMDIPANFECRFEMCDTIVRPENYQNHRRFGVATKLYDLNLRHNSNALPRNGNGSIWLENHYIRDEYEYLNIKNIS